MRSRFFSESYSLDVRVYTMEHRWYQFACGIPTSKDISPRDYFLASTNELLVEHLSEQRISALCSCLCIGWDRHQFACFISTVENQPNRAQFSGFDRARAARSSMLAEALPGLRMSALCSCTLNVFFFGVVFPYKVTHITCINLR